MPDSSARHSTAVANLDQVWGSLHVFLTFFRLVNFVLMQNATMSLTGQSSRPRHRHPHTTHL